MRTSPAPSSDPQPPKRSLWRRLRARLVPRISLRIFFILFTLLCIFLGGLAFWRQRAIDQFIACEQLDKADWDVEFEDDVSDHAKWSSWFRALPKWTREGQAFHLWFRIKSIRGNRDHFLAACQAASRLAYIGDLEFHSPIELNQDQCKAISSIRSLKSLNLSDAVIDDAGLQHIAKITNLEGLDLRGTTIGNAGARHLTSLRRLKSLYLDQTNIDDIGLESLVMLKNLETLSLARTQITAQGLAKLAPLRRLRNLDIDGTLVDDQVAPTISQFPALEYFSASDCALTDQVCAKMLHQPSLSVIKLDRTDITVKTLEALANLPNLSILQINGTKLKPGDLPKLLIAKKLEQLIAPRNTKFEDLLAFHQHPTLATIFAGHFEYSIKELKLFAGAASQEPELYVKHVALSDANWRAIAKAKSLRILDVYDCNLTDQTLEILTQLQNLTALEIDSCPITDAGLAHIASLVNLEELRIENAPITDEGLEHLTKLRNLKALSLENCTHLTEAGLATIEKLPALEQISAPYARPIDPPLSASKLFPLTSERIQSLRRLHWGQIELVGDELDLYLQRPLDVDCRRLELGLNWHLTPRQLQQIAAATQLTHLEIDGPAILDHQFASIGSLPRLDTVSIDSTPLGPQLQKWLASLPKLDYLHLYNLEVTDEAAKVIAASRSLRTINLRNVKLGPGALRHLAELPNLTSLDLDECEFDEASLLQLAAAKRLETLKVSHCRIRPQTLAQLLPQLPALDALMLSHCELGPEALSVIAKNGAKLTWLRLNYNPLKLDDVYGRMLEFPNLHYLTLAPETGEFSDEFDQDRLEWIRWDLLRKRGKTTPRPSPLPDSRAYFHYHGPRHLQIGAHWIDDALAIEMIRTNFKFSYLNASHAAVGGRFLQELAKTDHVANLDLSYTKITDDDLAAFADLTRVRTLHLSGCQITDRGAQTLAQCCPRLENLSLSHTKITGQSLQHLCKLRLLTSLDLSSTAVDDESLLPLRSLKLLTDVHVYETKVTPQVLEKLGPEAKEWLHGPEFASEIPILSESP